MAMTVNEFLASETKALDLRSILGPSLGAPLPEHCQQFSGLCASLYEGRAAVTKCIDSFIFGFEGQVERALNYTGDALRKSLSGAGMGSFGEALFGAAPERPAPHTELHIKRQAPGRVQASVAQLRDPPQGAPGPKAAAVDLASYGDMEMHAMHLAIEGGLPDPYSDLRFTSSVGAAGDLVTRSLDVLDRLVIALAHLAEAGPDSADAFKLAWQEALPNVTAFSRRFVDVEQTKFDCKQLGDKMAELSVDIPLDTEAAQRHYPGTAELMNLFDPLLITLCHPETKAVLANVALRAGHLQASVFMRDGQLLWKGPVAGSAQPLAWDEHGGVIVDAVVECSLVPLGALGVSLASIPFPEMKMRCLLERSGSILVKCVEAGECAFETVASVAFDTQHFRQLLLGGCRLDISHMPATLDLDKWVVHVFFRFCFPSGGAGTVFVQWFRDLIARQLQELDVVKALADMCAAAAADAEGLSTNDI